MDEIIRTEELSKHYGRVHAVSRISLKVRKSEIYGFLGLNGAGKTTSIRMLLGMIKPTSGKAFIMGKEVDPSRTDIWSNTGYMVETPYSYPSLTVRENLEIFKKMRKLSSKSAIDDVMNLLKLTTYADRKAKHLSSGNAQRLGLAKALMHKPKILILDEPINSLDPAGIREIRELLKDMAENHGVTIFISSHILGEISKLATRIGIIHNGVLLQEFDTPDLDQLCEKKLLVDTVNNENAQNFLIEEKIMFEKDEENRIFIKDNEYLNHPELIATMLVHKQIPPKSLQIQDEDLESYFLRTINSEGGQQ